MACSTDPAPTAADRYLDALGFDGRPTADHDGAARVLTAHLRTIPFANVDPMLGMPVSLDPDDVATKLLDRRRGGYCFEHAVLVRAGFEALGFAVEPVLARVLLGPGRDVAGARTHSANLIEIDGRPWLTDPGFGGSTPPQPVLADGSGAVAATPHGRYRIRSIEQTDLSPATFPDVDRVLQGSFDGSTWIELYGLATGPVVPADVEAFNHLVATSPTSPFTTGLSFARLDGDRITFDGLVLRRRRPSLRSSGGATSEPSVEERPIEGRLGFATVLAEDFGLRLDDEVDRLRATTG